MINPSVDKNYWLKNIDTNIYFGINPNNNVPINLGCKIQLMPPTSIPLNLKDYRYGYLLLTDCLQYQEEVKFLSGHPEDSWNLLLEDRNISILKQ